MEKTKEEIMVIVRTLNWLKLTTKQQDEFLTDLSKLLTKWELERSSYQLSSRENEQLERILNK